MIEAVENHNPEVIVIDEIGRELEAQAARTIAERGVQLIGTAHGNTLDNLMLNPTLTDLVGGIESVTLSDEEARRRGTQKTVLERRAPPTFDVLIEIQARDRLAVHHDVATAVDALLRGRAKPPELRTYDEKGEVHVEAAPEWQPTAMVRRTTREGGLRESGNGKHFARESGLRPAPVERATDDAEGPRVGAAPEAIRIYAYGIARNRLEQAARRLKVPALLVDDVDKAQALVTLKTYYRQHQRPIADAEERGLPIYVLRANTTGQIESFLSDLFNLQITSPQDDLEEAMTETQQAIDSVMRGEASADLAPASAYIRRLQHELARKHNLVSHSYGKEPKRWVRIFRD
jgi:hypothetical protein